jgi:hypothetical protein
MPPKRGRKSLSKPEVPIKEVAKPAPTAQASPGKTVTVENADVEMSLPKVDGPPLSKEAKLLSESFKVVVIHTLVPLSRYLLSTYSEYTREDWTTTEAWS